MSSPGTCPFCGSTKVIPAAFRVTDGNSASSYLHLPQIKEFPWWKYANQDLYDRQLSIQPPTACLACGMLWAKYDNAMALQLIERHGSPELKTMLAATETKAKPQA